MLQQVADGTMSLDDTVGKLDPALAETFPAIADITVEQLLGMTSGLPDYANEPKGVIRMVATDPSIQFSAEDLIRIGLAANTIQPPGTRSIRTPLWSGLPDSSSGPSSRERASRVSSSDTRARCARLPIAAKAQNPSWSIDARSVSHTRRV